MDFLNANITQNYTLAFIIGMLIVFPSLMPSVNAAIQKPTMTTYEMIDFPGKLIKLPFFYGFLNLLAIYLINTYFPEQYRKYWILGMLMGLVYPTLGTIDDYAKKVYGVKSYWNLYLAAQLMYIPIYGIVISYLAQNIC